MGAARVLPPPVLRYRRHDGDVWTLRMAGRRSALLRAMRRRAGRVPRRSTCLVSAAPAETARSGSHARLRRDAARGLLDPLRRGPDRRRRPYPGPRHSFRRGLDPVGWGHGRRNGGEGGDAPLQLDHRRGLQHRLSLAVGPDARQDGAPDPGGQHARRTAVLRPVCRPLFRHLPVGSHTRNRVHHGRRPLRQAGAARSAGWHPGRTPLATRAPGSCP